MRATDPHHENETTSHRDNFPAKLKIVDSSSEEKGHISKKSKIYPDFQQPWCTEVNGFLTSPSQCNPLNEPSPLGLRLKKSPSLLDLIQMRLSQGKTSFFEASVNANPSSKDSKKDFKAVVPSAEKLKASNFPASVLRIGSWEYKSRYEGDLVAKCYFAKHKLVWEVLEGGLKSKLEVQWSDILDLKANCPDNELGTLSVVLARQPLFFKEINPQPRKHTLWQATADFTNGQASIHREHFLQCPPGVLNKHFEKLIQCDMRLNFLSKQPDIVLDSLYFEQQTSYYTELHSSNKMESNKESNIYGYIDSASHSTAQSSSLNIEQVPTIKTINSGRSSSPSSVMDAYAIEGIGTIESNEKSSWNSDQPKVSGFHNSMSISDLASHLSHCISEQITAANPTLTLDGNSERCGKLEDIAQYLLNDSQLTSVSADEQSLMLKVNSLCCLLQKDPASEGTDEGKNVQVKCGNGFGNYEDAPKPSMSRKDSYAELLLHLPRIASLPKFLFHISEDAEGQKR